MTRAGFPLNESPRDGFGHDAGSIHAVRIHTLADGTATRYRITACGRTIGQYGTVPHAIGPTCKRCRAAIT